MANGISLSGSDCVMFTTKDIPREAVYKYLRCASCQLRLTCNYNCDECQYKQDQFSFSDLGAFLDCLAVGVFDK